MKLSFKLAAALPRFKKLVAASFRALLLLSFAFRKHGQDRVAAGQLRLPFTLFAKQTAYLAARVVLAPGVAVHALKHLRHQLILTGKLGLDLLNASAVLLDLSLKRIRSAALLQKLGFKLAFALAVVLDAVFQNGYFAVTIGAAALRLAQTYTRRLSLQILLAHFFREVFRGVVQSLLLGLSSFKVGLCLFPVCKDAAGAVMQLVERFHPNRNLKRTQLIAENKVFLSRFRLLLERVYLNFRLVYFIVYANKVFLSVFKLSLALVLAVAIAGYARRLLKKLAPVAAFG